ncbi:hypothetical protein GCM10011374_40160 [Kocuria dechangensis]|uniref:RAMA domain-containing protein n=1 Tax=Kocuria dechangensis TaxID=1176249 RepID=A0A917M1K4_9MICC|nr:hypothetical protein [Kocuria dechangensis]GGG71446.1 hypothetical protein GCM10011374_40160 [Kocuria dechangensis]
MTRSPRPRRTPTVHTATLLDLIGAELLKPGEALVSTRPSWPAQASVNADGSVNYDGQSYRTPSAAAQAVRGGRATNGWVMWAVERDGKKITLAVLRDRFEAGDTTAGNHPAAAPAPAPAPPAEGPAAGGEKIDEDAPDPSDIVPAPVPPEDTTEDPGLITSFGMFWEREKVDWSKGARILGHQAGSDKDVDFAQQVGVYLLHDGARTVYVGRVSKPRLGQRLFDHTKDRLSGRWDRFSWFGLRPVLANGRLGRAAETFGTDLVVATMEAILIEGLEPPQNRRQGDGMTGQEYQQTPDDQLQGQHMVATMMRLLQGRNEV